MNVCMCASEYHAGSSSRWHPDKSKAYRSSCARVAEGYLWASDVTLSLYT